MNEQLQQKLEELLVLAKSQGVSIVGLVDAPNADRCHIFKSIEAESKAGIRNLDQIMMRQVCSGATDGCGSCHMESSKVSQESLALLFSELQQPS
ncbi:hypothetical protein MD535_03605 [Vibrio sp. ZSDZ65]|uniref:Uncharacterized protein n=1 Tax=Vibrio qingdaonensis TaxID=2829491 RepID=A0A9X3CKU5_9VIBR|nr:hypothetical protein [Vibrio qingdaonensis]MCW8345114.1 hypothetical protein [Vibrio qingdaonensis]